MEGHGGRRLSYGAAHSTWLNDLANIVMSVGNIVDGVLRKHQ